MSERTENLGLKAMKEQEARILHFKIKGLREQIHRAANPYKALAELQPEGLAVAATALRESWDQYQRLLTALRALCAELNEPMPTFE